MPEISEGCTHERTGDDRSWGVNFRSTLDAQLGLVPAFEHRVLSDENGIVTEVGGDGVVSRWSRNGHSTRQFVRFPVETREDFREIAKRLDPSSPEHLAADWKQRPLALQAACGLATAAARRSAWNQEQPDV